MQSIESLKKQGDEKLGGLLYQCTRSVGIGQLVESGSEVQLEFTLVCNNSKIVEYTSENPYRRQLEHILPLGLRYIVSTMTKGERVIAWMDPLLCFGKNGFTYGDDGNERIPPRAGLVVDVYLKACTSLTTTTFQPFRDMKLSMKNMSTVLEIAEKAEGFFERGLKDMAMRYFRQSLFMVRQLRVDAEANPDDAKQRQEVALRLVLRATQCAYDTARYPQAVTLGREALQISPDLASASYLVGCAYFSLGYERSALQFLRCAHFTELNNPVYEAKLREIERHRSLIERNIDDEDDQTEYEEYATMLYNKNVLKNEKRMRKKIELFINEQLILQNKYIEIGGGFRGEFIQKIASKLTKSDRRLRLTQSEEHLGIAS